MKELIIIRHTTPDVENGICYGQLDLDVSSSFKNEINDINKVLDSLKPEFAYSSPLQRCAKLANVLYPNLEIKLDNRLTELNFGDWEGNFWKDIPKDHIDEWAPNFISQSPPNGESFSELIKRVELFEKDLLSLNHKKIAIVTHSGVIRAFLMKYLGIPAVSIFNLHLNYACIIKIELKSDEYHQVQFLKG